MRKMMLLFAVLGCAFSLNSASGGLIKSYDFNGDLTDTLGNGADMSSLGGNLGTAGRYTFDNNQGLILDAALLLTNDYRLEFKFQMATQRSGGVY